MHLHFDTQTFLTDRWGDAKHLTGWLRSYGCDIEFATVNQWFRRGRLPSQWGMTLLALTELETGERLSVSKYLT
jgi:hypothetical protein